jgi:hypothetical protein
MKRTLTLIAALMALPAAARAEALDLVCQGTALHTESSHTFAFANASNGESAAGQSTTSHRARTTESMRVRVDAAGQAKLKLPQSLIPVISIGKDGWWDFTTISITDDAIRGQFSLNFVNHPSVLIDRHTGDIDMKGMGMRFSGSCERAPDAPEAKKF